MSTREVGNVSIDVAAPAPAPLLTSRVLDALAPGIGRAAALGHHGELFQGQVRDRDGTLHRCLVSLPCPHLWSIVTFERDDTGSIAVTPPEKHKVVHAIERTLDYLGDRAGGRATVISNIAEGKGYGSSTTDCVAAVKATAAALGEPLLDREVARIVVQAETASDNTMFGHSVLFAQREGVVLEDYATTFPPLAVLGVDTQPDDIIDTLTFPPAEYSATEVQAFHALVPALRRAMRTQDAALLGRIATASSRINERYLPKPHFEAICRLVERHGGLGVAVAHSGTLVSLLFRPDDPDLTETLARARADLADLALTQTNEFHLRARSNHRSCAPANLKPLF